MNDRVSKGVGPLKKAGVWLLLILVSVSSFFLTNMMMSKGQHATQSQDQASLSCLVIVTVVLALFSLLAGIVIYIIVLATHCFTFNFEKPVWNSSLKARLYVSNILVGTALLLGFAGIATAIAGPLLINFLGLSREISLLIPFLVVFIPCQILLAWTNIWNPLICSLTRKRLLAIGYTQDEIKTGICAGVSDPTISSMKKFSMIEDDIGLLWITPQCIRYRGDLQTFEIDHSQLTEIERLVDKGSMAAYAGAVHIILHWKDDRGEHTKRLHLENYWTLSSLAGLYDKFALRLSEWEKGAAS